MYGPCELAQLPVQVGFQLFAWHGTVFTISGEVGHRETENNIQILRFRSSTESIG